MSKVKVIETNYLFFDFLFRWRRRRCKEEVMYRKDLSEFFDSLELEEEEEDKEEIPSWVLSWLRHSCRVKRDQLYKPYFSNL